MQGYHGSTVPTSERWGSVGARRQGLLAAEPAQQAAQVGHALADVGLGIEQLVGERGLAEPLGRLGGSGIECRLSPWTCRMVQPCQP